MKRDSKLIENLNAECSIVLGECGIEMRSIIEMYPNYESIDRSKKTLELLKLIKTFCYRSSTKRHPTMSALVARIKSHNHCHQEGKSVQDFLTELRALSDVAKAIEYS